jgi:hypothetical protein
LRDSHLTDISHGLEVVLSDITYPYNRGRLAGGVRADDYEGCRTRRKAGRRRVPEDQSVVFKRKPPRTEQSRQDKQSSLVEMLLDADELERRQLLLMALQTGELKKSEAGELLRLVDRLESVSGRNG